MANYVGVMSAKILDRYGIPGTSPITIKVADTETVAQLATTAADFVTVVQDVTDGVVADCVVTLTFPGSGEALDSGTGDIEKGGLFNFTNAETPYLWGILIPDLAASVLSSGGLIDLANTSITALIDYVTTSHGGVTVVNKGLEALTALADALITFRKHRKPLSRKTKEI